MTEVAARARPLTEAERRLLRCKIRHYRSRSGQPERVAGFGTAAVVGALWMVTLVASDVPWMPVTAFWLIFGVLIYLWVLRGFRKEAAHIPAMTSAMESALRRNEAHSFDIEAVAYAELKEWEDEGACWAFDLGDGRIVFLTGQEFYPSARFPSLDFSVVYPLTEDGVSIDIWLEKRGPALPPAEVLSARLKLEFADRLPETLEVISGSLDDLEELLRRRIDPPV